MIDEGKRRAPSDVKDMMIAGCRVRLSYGKTARRRWTVSAMVRCGVGESTEERSIVTQPFPTREAAERDALEQVTALLGHQTDRSRSRVRNWS
ncbi:MAG TPA: hypothetical protein VJR03_04230 [Nitrospira sp.]|nr:hypothetical protein [Nitrospira sp.]